MLDLVALPLLGPHVQVGGVQGQGLAVDGKGHRFPPGDLLPQDLDLVRPERRQGCGDPRHARPKAGSKRPEVGLDGVMDQLFQ